MTTWNDPHFGPKHLPPEKTEFVAWIDVMGTGSMMSFSHETAATNVGKLQTAVIQSDKADKLGLYPMMDGIYVTTDNRADAFSFLDDLFNRFSSILINRYLDEGTSHIKFSPIIRAGIAKGDVSHWEDLEETALAGHDHKNALLSGEAVAIANMLEENAPPFGIRVHGSLTSGIANKIMNRGWWKNDKQKSLVLDAMNEYFDYHYGRSTPPYPDEKIEEHRDEVEMYLG